MTTWTEKSAVMGQERKEEKEEVVVVKVVVVVVEEVEGELTSRLSSVRSTATPASTLPTVRDTSMI